MAKKDTQTIDPKQQKAREQARLRRGIQETLFGCKRSQDVTSALESPILAYQLSPVRYRCKANGFLSGYAPLRGYTWHPAIAYGLGIRAKIRCFQGNFIGEN